MSEDLTGVDRRNYIVNLLGEAYPDRISRGTIKRIAPDDWTDGHLDNALHVLKKRGAITLSSGGYQLRTAPPEYNQKLIDEANAGGAKAPDPIKGVSKMEATPMRLPAQHKADKKATKIPARTDNSDAAIKAIDPAPAVAYCEHGEPQGHCVRPGCDHYDAPANAEEYVSRPTAQELKAVEATFCRTDIDGALKDLEQQLAGRPPVEDLELKLDLLTDLERMLDARLKPVLAAIAKDLHR